MRLGPQQAQEAILELPVKEFDSIGKPMTGCVLVEPEGVEKDDRLSGWIQRALKFMGKLLGK